MELLIGITAVVIIVICIVVFLVKGNYNTLELLQERAEQGSVDAQYNLGKMHGHGDGVPQDYSKALKWFQKAAEQGHADAQVYLGGMYAFGRGVTQDDSKAAEWYREAADQGYDLAQLALGMVYAMGRGVPQDERKAVEWLKKAAAQGNEEAKKFLEEFSLKAEPSVGANETKVQQKPYLSDLQLRAEQGDADAQFSLGIDYEFDDDRKAAECYRKAAEHGYEKALLALGRMRVSGHGISRDDHKAADGAIKCNQYDPAQSGQGINRRAQTDTSAISPGLKEKFNTIPLTVFLIVLYLISFILYDSISLWRLKITPTMLHSVAYSFGRQLGDLIYTLFFICIASYIIHKFFIRDHSWRYISNIGLLFQSIFNILWATAGYVTIYALSTYR